MSSFNHIIYILYVPSLQNARCREKSTLTVLTLVFLAPVPVRNPPKSAP